MFGLGSASLPLKGGKNSEETCTDQACDAEGGLHGAAADGQR
jgi:hypothetical protein